MIDILRRVKYASLKIIYYTIYLIYLPKINKHMTTEFHVRYDKKLTNTNEIIDSVYGIVVVVAIR